MTRFLGLIIFTLPMLCYGQVELNRSVTGPVWRSMPLNEICATKWGRDVRHVTPAMRKAVAAEYGLKTLAGNELDHLGPRCLGGADDVRNLWPQSWTGRCNAHQKDRLEVRLCRYVCDGTLSLDDARAVFEDWQDGYSLYIDQAGC